MGIGIHPPNPSGGISLAESFHYILVNPGAGMVPGVMAVLTVLAFYRVGDALRDRLAVESCGAVPEAAPPVIKA